MCLSVCVLQAVKFEPYHDSALVRFLLKRALRVSRTNICVFVLTLSRTVSDVSVCLFLWFSVHLFPFCLPPRG